MKKTWEYYFIRIWLHVPHILCILFFAVMIIESCIHQKKYSAITQNKILTNKPKTMTAYEAYLFTTQELNKIANVQAAVKSGAVKEKDLPEEFKQNMSAENKERLTNVNKRAHVVLMEELNQWL
jgi:hypothetical protein